MINAVLNADDWFSYFEVIDSILITIDLEFQPIYIHKSKLYSQENVLSDPDVYLIDLIDIFFSSFCIVQHLHCTYQNYVFFKLFLF